MPQPDDELEWTALAPAAGSHLMPCPHCGSPNGLSASICWNCEAALVPQESFGRWLSPWPAASVSTPRPPASPQAERADESPPAATSAPPGQEPMAKIPVPARGRRRRLWEIGAPILALAVAAGVFLYFDAPTPIGGFGEEPQPGASLNAPPALNVQPAPARVPGASDAPAADVDTRDAALRALAVEPQTSAPDPAPPSAVPTPPADAAISDRGSTEPVPVAASKAMQAGKARDRSRSPNPATATPLHRAERPEPSWQTPAPPARPCTPTVAALGLCSASPMESKE